MTPCCGCVEIDYLKCRGRVPNALMVINVVIFSSFCLTRSATLLLFEVYDVKGFAVTCCHVTVLTAKDVAFVGSVDVIKDFTVSSPLVV